MVCITFCSPLFAELKKKNAFSKAMFMYVINVYFVTILVGGEASMVATPLFKMAALGGDKNAKYSYGQLLFRGTVV